MFNKEIKNKYIAYAVAVSDAQDIQTYKKNIINWFNRIGDFEKGFKKDMLDMTPEEIKILLGKFLKGGKLYQENNLCTLKTYCRWGIECGLSSINVNWLDNLKLSDIKIEQTYANTMVSSETELIEVIDTVLEDINRNSSDNIIRCICLLLFAGIKYDDIWYLKDSDIDLDKKIIVYKSRTIEMSDALYEILKHNRDMEEMVIVGRGRTAERISSIIHEGYVISNSKEYNGNREKMKKFYNVSISKKLSESNQKDLTNTTIYDSGVFYRIYLNEKNTGEINCLEYLWARRNRYTTIEFPERVKNRCCYEYIAWKNSLNVI